MEELRPGLWTWTARHPAWRGPEEGWGPIVRSYALETEDALVLLDPLEPPAALVTRTNGRRLVVVISVVDHQRSAGELAGRAGAEVWAPAEAVARLSTAAEGYAVGDRLPGGVEAREGFWPDEATLWIPAHGALVTGDVLLGEDGFRILPDDWLGDAGTAADVRAALRPLLDLPTELLLPTHGDPIVHDAAGALRRALEG